MLYYTYPEDVKRSVKDRAINTQRKLRGQQRFLLYIPRRSEEVSEGSCYTYPEDVKRSAKVPAIHTQRK